MVTVRKKKLLDGMDREILRKINGSRKGINANTLSKRVGMTASGIRPRLTNLKSKGMIKPLHTQGIRKFTRTFGNKKVVIRAPRSISWGIDLKKPRKKR